MMNAEQVVRHCLQARDYQSPGELDSLQLVELVLDIEERAGVSIDEALIGTGVTFDEVVEVLREAIMTQKGGRSDGGS